jgi:hypothetical protein
MSNDYEPTDFEKEMVAKMYELKENQYQSELGNIIAGAILDGQNQIHDLYKKASTAEEIEARMRRSFVYWKDKLNSTLKSKQLNKYDNNSHRIINRRQR